MAFKAIFMTTLGFKSFTFNGLHDPSPRQLHWNQDFDQKKECSLKMSGLHPFGCTIDRLQACQSQT
jgi:hypothetical protein